MANYQVFASRLRTDQVYDLGDGNGYQAYPVTSVVVIRDDGLMMLPMDYTDPGMGYLESMPATEPLEYGDDMTDIRRKAMGPLRGLWPFITETDVVNVTWLDA